MKNIPFSVLILSLWAACQRTYFGGIQVYIVINIKKQKSEQKYFSIKSYIYLKIMFFHICFLAPLNLRSAELKRWSVIAASVCLPSAVKIWEKSLRLLEFQHQLFQIWLAYVSSHPPSSKGLLGWNFKILTFVNFMVKNW